MQSAEILKVANGKCQKCHEGVAECEAKLLPERESRSRPKNFQQWLNTLFGDFKKDNKLCQCVFGQVVLMEQWPNDSVESRLKINIEKQARLAQHIAIIEVSLNRV